MSEQLSCLEICAGAGGQSIGLELAGFAHEAAVEIERDACETLRLNRPHWKVHEGDVRDLDGRGYRGIDLLAGGVPCPPFSIAGKQLGSDDDRDLFPEAIRLAGEARPAAVLLENVRGLASLKFASYRSWICGQLESLGYSVDWKIINACEHGVPQLRPRFVLVALSQKASARWQWPRRSEATPTVAECLYPFMARDGWTGATNWAAKANGIAPTIVGGSKKHGGADLGPTRVKAEWRRLGVDAMGIADSGPDETTAPEHIPRLTLEMVAAVQRFPADWRFAGRKTAAYRQIGNAFPPPVAEAVGKRIFAALKGV